MTPGEWLVFGLGLIIGAAIMFCVIYTRNLETPDEVIPPMKPRSTYRAPGDTE